MYPCPNGQAHNLRLSRPPSPTFCTTVRHTRVLHQHIISSVACPAYGPTLSLSLTLFLSLSHKNPRTESKSGTHFLVFFFSFSCVSQPPSCCTTAEPLLTHNPHGRRLHFSVGALSKPGTHQPTGRCLRVVLTRARVCVCVCVMLYGAAGGREAFELCIQKGEDDPFGVPNAPFSICILHRGLLFFILPFLEPETPAPPSFPPHHSGDSFHGGRKRMQGFFPPIASPFRTNLEAILHMCL